MTDICWAILYKHQNTSHRSSCTCWTLIIALCQSSLNLIIIYTCTKVNIFQNPTVWRIISNSEPYVHVCMFSLYTFYLPLLFRQASITVWTIFLISKSWWWLLKPKHLTSTLHHNKFTYLDYSVFLLSSYTCVYHIYPTPPLGQDMTQGQFLSGV